MRIRPNNLKPRCLLRRGLPTGPRGRPTDGGFEGGAGGAIFGGGVGRLPWSMLYRWRTSQRTRFSARDWLDDCINRRVSFGQDECE